MMAVFRICLSNAVYGFSGFAKEVTPCSRAETVIPSDRRKPSTQTFVLARGMDDSRYLGPNGY